MDGNHEPIRVLDYRNNEVPAPYGMSDTSSYEKFLTIEDLKRVTRLQDVRRVPFHPEEFLGSDLNFVNGQGDKILCVTFTRASLYNTYRSKSPEYFISEVKGIGEEAFIGTDTEGEEPFMLAFRKGDHAVSLTTSVTRDGRRNILTLDELITIGGIIASRL